MQINWKVRFQNKTFLAGLISLVVVFIYDLLQFLFKSLCFKFLMHRKPSAEKLVAGSAEIATHVTDLVFFKSILFVQLKQKSHLTRQHLF